MTDLDAFLTNAVLQDTIDLHASPSDHFGTAGMLQWVDSDRRLRSGHQLDFNGATLELDVDRVTDEMLKTEQPILMLGSQFNNIYPKTGEEAWGLVATHTAVRNVKFVGNFSKLAPRAKALGVSLRISACGLQGHDAHMSGVILSDFGAYRHNPNGGAEAFPLWIYGADSSFDCHALSTVDPSTHTFEPASIEYTFQDYAPEHSNDQVSVGIICGATCPANLQLSPWKQSGPWTQIMRKDAQLKYDITASGDNLVQGGTLYQTLKGTVDGRTSGVHTSYYSDYYTSKGVHILPSCSFKGGSWGVMIRLSPSAGEYTDLPLQFSAEDFVIEYFDTDAIGGAVGLIVDPMPDGSFPEGRYIKNVAIDERLRGRVMNEGDRAGVVWIPAPDTGKKGCRPF